MYVIQSDSYCLYGAVQHLYVAKTVLDVSKYRVGEKLPAKQDRWLYHTISADTPEKAKKFTTRTAAEQFLERITNRTEQYKIIKI